MEARSVQVVIAGGGPCGLMLANELGCRGIRTFLIDEKPSTAFNPQANATQARTMEHFRRLGFADEIRALGLPPEFPTDIAYFTRFSRHELARFSLPSSRDAKGRAASTAWPGPELPHRVSQKFVEQVLRRHAEALPGNEIRYGWRLIDFAENADGVECVVEEAASGRRESICSEYLFGADGPRSFVRERLGFGYAGETGVIRDFMGGRMFALYVRCPDFYRVVPHAPAWMNVTFNNDRRAFMAAVDGRGEFAFHTQLRAGENPDEITDAMARDMFQAAVGLPVDVEIFSKGAWTAGHALVANHFQRGRVFLGGDAVHLFTPTGGLGYNTAIEDAVNIGWKLAMVLKGLAPAALLASYETERRPLAIRNTGFARGFADSLGLYKPAADIEADTAGGGEARRLAGEYFNLHARAEFNIPGITFGGRYDGSPIIIPDGAPPSDAANSYTPSACPGGRPPHIWLQDGRSLYDTFGFEWTLLCLGKTAPLAADIRQAAAARHMDLKLCVVDSEEARDVFGAEVVLIRPDQIVAWRGNSALDAEEILDRVIGMRETPAPAPENTKAAS